jgi:hypothetical protein
MARFASLSWDYAVFSFLFASVTWDSEVFSFLVDSKASASSWRTFF